MKPFPLRPIQPPANPAHQAKRNHPETISRELNETKQSKIMENMTIHCNNTFKAWKKQGDPQKYRAYLILFDPAFGQSPVLEK